MHIPKIVEIKRIIDETEMVKTFIFDWEVKDEKPGHFMMVWNFHDEKPMSLSIINPVNNEIGISIKKVGEFTEAVHQMEVGDELGLRGPLGCGFEIVGSKILAVGGGIGMAPIAAFVEDARSKGADVHVISAAKTKNELLFIERLERIGANVYACTDDGSYGFHGFAGELAEKLLKESDNNQYNMVVTCGPELMMKGIFDIVNKCNLQAQFSIERYMKCAIGLCGQCCVDDTGWRVCVEGPVFSKDDLKLISEFGKYKRDASGIKHLMP